MTLPPTESLLEAMLGAVDAAGLPLLRPDAGDPPLLEGVLSVRLPSSARATYEPAGD